ncbi:phenazine antibiotic biosynthesis protein [Longimycelium tulufanense]|uniref:Phenazine antibiotic biosynthesis protein n=1 Tax=Longimycelium tulufanense TaxID=907463 RepID=A0A8J3C794_9PSEU|nr:AMP-binding protein [Longimycelium tulufanense]GGM33808.1 phenazine antibiotic biosynthesis protein [Longimycelium tulufanense]
MADDTDVLDAEIGQAVDEREFIEAAMRWHFDPATGSPYWLERARSLDFDPRRDVHTFADLRRFPNIVNELRTVPIADLVPKGYGPEPEVYGVYESGGTTGLPKRVVFLADWVDKMIAHYESRHAERGLPRGGNWLFVGPTGPHLFGAMQVEMARRNGSVLFTVDLDPRWVKRCVAEGRPEEANRYADHLVDQARSVLETQDITFLVTTPPLLERLTRDDELATLVAKVPFINWGGAHMDADTRHLYRTEVLPNSQLFGGYGSTMVLTGAPERPGLGDDDPCVFDPPSPFVTFVVVDPETGEAVPHGERGQVVMNHVSRGMLLPNNLERDMATRIEPPEGGFGDSVADVTPVATFDGGAVIEGVY